MIHRVSKKLAALSAVAAVVLCMAPYALAASVPHDGKEVQIQKGGWAFLHGNAVIFTQGDSPLLTKVYKDVNDDGQLGPEDELLEFSGLDGTKDGGYDLQNTIFYCIGTSAYPGYKTHEGDIRVTMLGGAIKELNGSMFCTNTGNFIFSMQGGTIASKVCPVGSAPEWKGDISVTVGGDARIGQSVYGGSENGNAKIQGNISVAVKENAVINEDGRYGDAGVFAGGQQPGDTVEGSAVVTIAGGTVNGLVAGDLFQTNFQQGVTIDFQNGQAENIAGLYDKKSSAGSVKVSVTGGSVGYNCIGSLGATVEGEVALELNGGTINGAVAGLNGGGAKSIKVSAGGASLPGGIIGAISANTENACITIKAGTVGSVSLLQGTEGACGAGELNICGGILNGRAALRAADETPKPADASILVSGMPAMTENGHIFLREGEFITQTGPLACADGAVKVDVSAINREGALVVQPGQGTVADAAKYGLINASYGLIPGRAEGNAPNLYLGKETEALPEKPAETVPGPSHKPNPKTGMET